MNALTLEEFAARVQRERIATALNVTKEAVAVLLGDSPADIDENDRLELQAEADAARESIQTALVDARDEVASAVAVRYEWNAVRDSALLKRLIADRALFHLHGDVVPEDMEALRRNSLVLLGALRKGSRVLVDDRGEPYLRRPQVRATGADPVFSRRSGAMETY